MPDELSGTKKDYLVLAMLAVLGGERTEVNERDLFLACWHAFPNAMRWVDTALPNPDTFTAALRRLDASGIIARVGKQARAAKGRRRSKSIVEPGRSGVVRARIIDGGLNRAGVSPEMLEMVRELAPDPSTYRSADPVYLIILCAQARREDERHVDESSLVETAFHRFPAVFAYGHRPEFPDTGLVRKAIEEAVDRGLLSDRLELTANGSAALKDLDLRTVRLDDSTSHGAGAFKFAQRIQNTDGFVHFHEDGTLVATKADELFRLLRVPPATDPKPLAHALVIRMRELTRIDRADLARYLVALANKHNPESLFLARPDIRELSPDLETS